MKDELLSVQVSEGCRHQRDVLLTVQLVVGEVAMKALDNLLTY